MFFTRIDSTSHPLFAECRKIYCNNFPPEEQRELQEQERVFKTYRNFHFMAITECDKVVGLITYWRFINCFFIEHLAIHNNYKGQGYGSRAIEHLKQLSDNDRVPALLEIEIPDTPKKIRRAGFYTKLNFDMSSISHFQPPFHEGEQPLEMRLMCYPYIIGEQEYNRFKEQYYSIMPDFSPKSNESGMNNEGEMSKESVSVNNAENNAKQADEPAEVTEPADETTFSQLGLGGNILKAIDELGYKSPTPVQKRIIPQIIGDNRDLVCLAQTGTGKTAAFGLPVLQKIEKKMASGNIVEDIKEYQQHNTDPNKKWYSFFEKRTQVLILSPTRELCRQIAQDLKNYSKYIEGLSVVPVYGGANIEQQIRSLKRDPQIIVATPGRMLDLLKRKAADISGIHTLILDEADEMLNMGFKEELDGILESAPEKKQVLLFSATMPAEVESIAHNYMKQAEVVTVGERNSGSDNVLHFYYTVHEKERYAALKRIADYNPDIYGIIFCRTKSQTQEISDSLIRDGYNADALHGDLSQAQRDHVMLRFKSRTLQMLVATDVAARGIDVNNLSHVINYNLPDEVEQYTHRSGRTGRADKTGQSIVIINSKELHKIRRIEKIIGKEFTKSQIPTGEEVCSRQLVSLIEKIRRIPVDEKINEYLPLVEEQWKDLSREDIIKKFISCEFNRFIEYYRNAPDLNIQKGHKGEAAHNAGNDSKNFSDRSNSKQKEGKRGKRGGKLKSAGDEIEPRRAEKGYDLVKLNIGEKNKITTRHLIRLMTSVGIGKRGIGRIEIRHNTCYISIADRASQYVVEQLNNTDYRGVRLKCSVYK